MKLRDSAGQGAFSGRADRLTFEALEERVLLNGTPTLFSVDLLPTSDTGESATDRITSDTTPTIVVRTPSAGTVMIDWENDGVFDVTDPVLAEDEYQYTPPLPGLPPNALSETLVVFRDALGRYATELLPITIDTTDPGVVSAPAGTLTGDVTELVVQLDGLMDSDTVTQNNRFDLIGSGGDGTFGDGNEIDHSDLIGTITYNETTNEVTLPLASALAPDTYQLTIRGSSTRAGVTQNLAFVRTAYVVGNAPAGIVTNDFNQDGRLDLAITNQYDDSVSVLYNLGNAVFGNRLDIAVGKLPSGITSADFNLDGRADLALANNVDNSVSILFGQPGGGFGARADYLVPTGPWGVAAGDFNQDGWMDLSVANKGSNSISVLWGQGGGALGGRQDYAAGVHPTNITTGDFNRDGRADLGVTNYFSNSVTVYYGQANGTLGQRGDYASAANPFGITAHDLNADGFLDLASATNSGNVSILWGQAAGTFVGPTNYVVDGAARGIIAGDFNRDGRMDIATSSYSTNRASILLGQQGGFAPHQDFYAGSGPMMLTAGDFNGNGWLDLATPNSMQKVVAVLLNQGATLGVRDVAGNPLAGGADVTSTFDVDRPSLSVDLAAASDSGASNSDHITNDTTPTLMAIVNYTGTLAVDWESDGTFDTTVAAPASGPYALTPATPLAPGQYNVTVRFSWGPNGHLPGSLTETAAVTIVTAGPTVASATPAADQIVVAYAGAVGMWEATATDPANYVLAGFDGGVPIAAPGITNVTYDAGAKTATIHLDANLTATATYQLTVKGTATVRDVAGNPLNDGADTVVEFLGDPNDAPTAGELTADVNLLGRGDALTLTANRSVGDADGTVVSASFYEDTNGNGAFDEGVDALLGTDTNGADGWQWSGATTAFATGRQFFFARVLDDYGDWSQPVRSGEAVDVVERVGGWQSGDVRVDAFDMDGGAAIAAAGISVVFGPNNTVRTITLSGNDPMAGLGLVISGATWVGRIADARAGAPAALSMVVSNAAVDTVIVGVGIDGFEINGMRTANLALAADVDGDGVTTDLTGVYAGGALRFFYANGAGTIAGDLVAAGHVTRVESRGIAVAGDVASLSAGSIDVVFVSGAALAGNVRTAGAIGIILSTNGIGVAGNTISAGTTVGRIVALAGDVASNVVAGSGAARAVGVVMALAGDVTGQVTTTQGGIGSVIASRGAVRGKVEAEGVIYLVSGGTGVPGAVKGKVVVAVLAGGDISGDVYGWDDNLRAVGLVLARAGNVSGSVTSAGGVGSVIALAGVVSGATTAGGQVQLVRGGAGVTGAVRADQVGSVLAMGGNATGDVEAFGAHARAVGMVWAAAGNVAGNVQALAGGVGQVLSSGGAVTGNVTATGTVQVVRGRDGVDGDVEGDAIVVVQTTGGNVSGNVTALGAGVNAVGAVIAFGGSVSGRVEALAGGVGRIIASTGAVTGNVFARKSLTMLLAGNGIGLAGLSRITAAESIGVLAALAGNVQSFITAGTSGTGGISVVQALQGTLLNSRIRSLGALSVVLARDVDGTNVTGASVGRLIALNDVQNTLVAAGYDFGADGAIGGGDDALVSGHVHAVLVLGGANNAVIAAGVGPGVDDTYGTGDDLKAGINGRGGRIGSVNIVAQARSAGNVLAAEAGAYAI